MCCLLKSEGVPSRKCMTIHDIVDHSAPLVQLLESDMFTFVVGRILVALLAAGALETSAARAKNISWLAVEVNVVRSFV